MSVVLGLTLRKLRLDCETAGVVGLWLWTSVSLVEAVAALAAEVGWVWVEEAVSPEKILLV